jgi:hypothetical protein
MAFGPARRVWGDPAPPKPQGSPRNTPGQMKSRPASAGFFLWHETCASPALSDWKGADSRWKRHLCDGGHSASIRAGAISRTSHRGHSGRHFLPITRAPLLPCGAFFFERMPRTRSTPKPGQGQSLGTRGSRSRPPPGEAHGKPDFVACRHVIDPCGANSRFKPSLSSSTRTSRPSDSRKRCTGWY